jgi:hypothetical protein
MPFECGRFYRRQVDNVAYRCEQAEDSRTLLHSADLSALPVHDKRVTERGEPSGAWSLVPEDQEGPLIETYTRDAVAEYGAEVGERAIIYRRQYHFDPYLSIVGDAEIRERLKIIADNSFRYDAHGAVHLVSTGAEFWHRKSEEIVEELRLNQREGFFTAHPADPRVMILGLPYDIGEKEEYAQNAPWGRLPELPSLTAPALYKFSRYNYLHRAIEHGELRISPASSYNDPGLGVAHRDTDEQRLIIRPSKMSFPITVKDHRGRTILDTSADRDNQLAIVIGGERDFYVWCCSQVYEPRLFIDFKADACLIVRDREEFARRINAGLLAKYPRLPYMRGDNVRYYDPLSPDDVVKNMTTMPLAVMFFKDWSYSYQTEYRFVWLGEPGATLAPIDIEVKPLGDICELVQLGPLR